MNISNGSQVMGKGLWPICMHHWRVHAKVEFPTFPPDVRTGGVNHLSTFDPELRNVSFALISFMGFPAILSTLQPFQICIYKRKYSIWAFSNGSPLMGKRFKPNLYASLESTCISTRCQNWGVNHLSTFDPELKNVSFALISFMGFPAILSALQPFQICIYKRKYSIWTFSNGSPLMGKRFMANLHASLESTCKGRISNISTRCQNWGVNHLSTFDAELRNVSFTLISFIGFPATLSALQPFQICIYKRKYSIWTFSNGSPLMGKRFMANLHGSLESTCISTRCQNLGWGVNHLSILILNLEM